MNVTVPLHEMMMLRTCHTHVLHILCGLNKDTNTLSHVECARRSSATESTAEISKKYDHLVVTTITQAMLVDMLSGSFERSIC